MLYLYYSCSPTPGQGEGCLYMKYKKIAIPGQGSYSLGVGLHIVGALWK